MSASQELNEAQCCLSRAAMILKELGLTSLAVQLRRTENLLRQIIYSTAELCGEEEE